MAGVGGDTPLARHPRDAAAHALGEGGALGHLGHRLGLGIGHLSRAGAVEGRPVRERATTSGASHCCWPMVVVGRSSERERAAFIGGWDAQDCGMHSSFLSWSTSSRFPFGVPTAHAAAAGSTGFDDRDSGRLIGRTKAHVQTAPRARPRSAKVFGRRAHTKARATLWYAPWYWLDQRESGARRKSTSSNAHCMRPWSCASVVSWSWHRM